MTVRIADGKATIPLWAAISLIVTILLGAAGWVALATDKANETAHKALELRIEKVELAIGLMPEMQKDIAIIADRLGVRIDK